MSQETSTMRPPNRVTTLTLVVSLAAAAWALLPGCGGAETLALRRPFVDGIKDRATLAVQLEVDVHPKDPHSISSGGNDGDIHMAGRASEVGLPLVAEILNAGSSQESAALQLLRGSKPGSTLAVTGVWRIWFEHLGTAPQVQGADVPVPSTSNPNHLFEIHPITRFGPLDLLDSLRPIPGYTAYPATTAFPFYENAAASIQANATAITIESGEGRYNYAEFYIQLDGAPLEVVDGILALAQVFSDSTSKIALTAEPRRMVAVKGSGPAAEIKGLGQDRRLHVLGIPRVNLSEVAAIAQAQGGTGPVQVHLPYEMIIVAVLP
jgi:hypothetical protein